MSTSKASLVLLALVAGCALAQAAGGIKGVPQESRFQAAGIKGPRQQLPPVPQAQEFAPAPLPPRPPTKGAGQVAPVFTAARVQPVQQQQIAPEPVQQLQQQQQEQEPEPVQQQQQEEANPEGAAQDAAPAVLAPARAEEEANPRPEPYAFNYAFDSGDQATSGSSQREEQQDASGRVTGFYTLRGEDGRDRRVDYVADASGFRATVSTNELGTAPKDSADVDWNAQPATDAQLRAAESATNAARQRALANPQPEAAASFAGSNGKISSPRKNSASYNGPQQQQQQQQQQQVQVQAAKGRAPNFVPQPAAIAQLQEPFEQIRQTELNARARKSRHAPFYLYTI